MSPAVQPCSVELSVNGLALRVAHPQGMEPPKAGTKCRLCIRPEHLGVSRTAAAGAMTGTVRTVQFLGTHHLVELDAPVGTLLALSVEAWTPGDQAYIAWDPARVRLLPN